MKRKQIILSILVLSLLFAAASAPATSAPNFRTAKEPQPAALVNEYLKNVGWSEKETYEDTDMRLKDLLLQMITKNKTALKWMKNLNNHFNSIEFKDKNNLAKQRDIMEAKIYAKLAIREVLNIDP